MLEAQIPGTGHTVRQHPHDEFGTGATVITDDGQVMSGSQVKDQAQLKANEVQGQARVSISELAN